MIMRHEEAPPRGGGGASLNDLQKLYGQAKDSTPHRPRAGIDGLLSRLERVRQTGPGRWLACCPAHDDRKPSLHITLKDDGRTLIHCISHQCGAPDIMAAVGLSLADLFPDRGEHHRPGERPRVPAQDVLAAIVPEVWIVYLCGSDVLNGFDLDETSHRRLALAVSRIKRAARLGGARC